MAFRPVASVGGRTAGARTLDLEPEEEPALALTRSFTSRPSSFRLKSFAISPHASPSLLTNFSFRFHSFSTSPCHNSTSLTYASFFFIASSSRQRACSAAWPASIECFTAACTASRSVCSLLSSPLTVPRPLNFCVSLCRFLSAFPTASCHFS